MEKILSIKQTTFKIEEDKWSGGYEGYEIITNKQTIRIGIGAYQSCCENWGYFMSEDNIDEFIGSEIIDIKLTDTNLSEAQFQKHEVEIGSEYFEGGVMFVDLHTSNGILQFVTYNEHNGYYGHDACIVSKQLTKIEIL